MATIRKRDHKNGGVSYQAQVRVKGRPLVTATFKRKTDATRWAHDTESDIRHGRYFKTTEAQKHTVGEMVDRYIKEVLPEKKDGTNQGDKVLAVVCTDNPYADVWVPMESTCSGYTAAHVN